MSTAHTLSSIASCTFGSLCIASALPFIGIPFPNQRAADYYAKKSQWMAQLSGNRLTPAQAGVAGAVQRVVVGAGCIYQPTREIVLMVNLGVIVYGTYCAYRDGKPKLPQWGVLGAMGLCLVLGRL